MPSEINYVVPTGSFEEGARLKFGSGRKEDGEREEERMKNRERERERDERERERERENEWMNEIECDRERDKQRIVYQLQWKIAVIKVTDMQAGSRQ